MDAPQIARTYGLRAQIELRQRILNYELPGGTRLYEVALAEEMNISRTPVREALSRLAEEGLLERTRSGGFVVRSFKKADVLDIIALRGLLEGAAARLAAERGVCAADLAKARQLLCALDTCFGPAPGDVALEQYSELNDAFHLLLSQFAKSAVLEREIARVARLPFAAPSAFLPHRARLDALAETLVLAHAQHHSLLNAVAARQGSRAEALAREHCEAARENVELVFDNQLSTQTSLPPLGLVAR